MNIKIFEKEKKEFILNTKKQNGFTLIETMVAVFILSIAIVSIIGAISRSYLASMYANNDITATYLLQEAVDYIRNDRDINVIFGNDSDKWSTFVSKYSSCRNAEGCFIDIENSQILACSSEADDSFGEIICPRFTFDVNSTPYYSYKTFPGNSNFKRKIYIKNEGDAININVTVEWQNGNFVRSRSLEYSLLNWMK